MSTCVSRHGEYGNHAGGDDWFCSRCGVFDADGVLAALDYTQERMAEMVPKNWHGLMEILDDIYPESVFPPDRQDRDLGPRIVSLLRHLAEARDREQRIQKRLRVADTVNAGWLRTEDVELAMTGEWKGSRDT
jgi:hypothetical protein